jgi:CAAX prenyl protease-like protein
VVIRQHRADFAAAAVIAQPFTVYLVVMRFLRPPTADEWSHADPILRFLPLWLIPALAVVAAIAWVRLAKPALGRALRHALFGVIAAGAICAILRLIYGPHLPRFIPPEESAAPGLLLNMSAGYAEEIIFRIALLPALLIALRRVPLSLFLAIALSGLAFALAHDFHLDAHFATRFLIPGCAFSLAALLISPAFLVTAHCTAHVLIPLLF